ncbi:MAG: TldD/PmbA family protein [Candidatus Helarchaeota archaeon]
MVERDLTLLAPEEIFDAFTEIISGFSSTDLYADILYDCTSSLRIHKTKSKETITVNPKTAGIVIRAYGDVWSEIAVTSLGDLADAARRLQERSSKQKLPLTSQDPYKLNEKITPKIPHDSISLEEKLSEIQERFKLMEKHDERIINPIIAYSESQVERILVNTEGAELRQVIPRTRIFLQPIAREGARTDFDYYSEGGEVGVEILKNLSAEIIETAVKNSIQMLKAEHPPAGTFPVVLDPDMTGLVAHESFGHGLEADQVLRDRSYLKPYFQKQVASEITNIFDGPTVEGQVGTFFFDDEGIPAQTTQLVQDGILVNFLHTRETAAMLNAKPRGNGRRESFAHNVYVRMTNTYFQAGNHDLEELFEGIKKGVFLVRGYFGMEDPLGGGMQCTSKKGFLIENGEISKLLGPVTLSGKVLDLLQSIDAISKETIELRSGMCGKGYEDFVPVSSGGPHVRAQHAIVGPG